MKKLIALSLLVCFCMLLSFTTPVSAATSSISNLVFTTDARTVLPGVVSDSITVQTQNASGASEEVDETNDVTFTSSSPTGLFLNSSGNPVTTTMSKNTSSRTFYYKDSATGTFTLSVSVKGRTTGTTFSASQQVAVGAAPAVTSGTTTATSTSGTTTATSTPTTDTATTTTVTTSVATNTSAHSDGSDISNFKSKIEFGVDAGRDRIITVNAPIKFDAEVGNFSENLYARVACDWSFGDGLSASGKSVDHVYAFPGTYNLVLNATIGETKVVDRMTVTVVEPQLSVASVVRGPRGYVEIENSGETEVNLQSFKVRSGEENFIFAPDTIMSPHSKTKFPFAFSSNTTGTVSLIYPEGEVAATLENGPVALIEEPEPYIPVASSYRPEREAPPPPSAPIHAPTQQSTTSTPNSDQTASIMAAMQQSQGESGILPKVFNFFGQIFGK